jgi:aspartyl-tRNA(Asn)/glutamyl-tRNA(Gln) amidotransferase subunit A
MSLDFRTARLADLAAMVQRREVSARELTEHALHIIEARNPSINAFVAIDGERAVGDARAIDERIAHGDTVGPLAGIPIGVKDLEDAAGFTTTQGSAVHADGPAAADDSVLVARLRAAGCVVLGKTNTPELGWQAESTNPVFGSTHHPLASGRSSGGSSGGASAAVAAGMVPLATGSDGGGSIRIPSALCGLTGLKPSLGRVPSGGAMPPGWANLSTKGPMAIAAADVAYALDVCVGPERTDLRSLPLTPDAGTWHRAVTTDPSLPSRIGFSATLGYAIVDDAVAAAVRRAVDAIAASGTEVVEIDTVFEEDPVLGFLTIANVGSLLHHQPVAGSPAWDLIDPGLRSWLAWAEQNVSAVRLADAEALCHRLNHRLQAVMDAHDIDLLVTPTVAGRVPELGSPGLVNGEPDPSWVRFTYPFNMTRSPAGTVDVGPCTPDDPMPVGLQVVGRPHDDLTVLQALAAIESLRPSHTPLV